MLPRNMITGLVLVIAATGLAQAQVSPGDMNCDGTVDGLDIPLFVDCVLNGNCDHCGMVSVPGGEFRMGDPWSEGDSDDAPGGFPRSQVRCADSGLCRHAMD